jgi:uncharacterized protein (TIGR00251 family)
LNPCRRDGDDLLLLLHVQPGAKRCELTGMHGDALKVRVAAPATGGRANRALVAYLAEQFGVPRSRVVLERGQDTRRKRVRVVEPAQLPAGLAAGR